MRLLYISKASRGGELSGFFWQLTQLGYTVMQLAGDDITEVNVISANADLVLIHHNRQLRSIDFWKTVKGSSKIIYWVNDERYPPEPWRVQFIKVVDLFLVASIESVEAIRDSKGKADYMIMGIKPKVYVDDQRPINICFTGQNSGDVFPLSRYRQDLVEGLQHRIGKDFHVYGKGWDKCVSDSIGSGIYSLSKIGLSVGHYNTSGCYSNRVLQIMTNGALCLMHETKRIRDIFKDNVVYFSDVKDAFRKYREWVADPAKCFDKALQGKTFVDNYMSWEAKAIEINKMINTWL